ncbi:hypothetical protein QBC42DRAFT_2736 [Cladorrhinum samala]|uniref:Uncharacterized protein n=1 Tax=Cladorrhinum samala TaxID=585594 RepID=A0AAV9I7S4_9PEZI|nr:hypothetical protein QBC42DRAFT_2736 [Cladorrhinum samala]
MDGHTGYEAIFGLWPYPNSIPNVPSLSYGYYGLRATSGNNPPLARETLRDIHLVSYIENGKHVWLPWKEVEAGGLGMPGTLSILITAHTVLKHLPMW